MKLFTETEFLSTIKTNGKRVDKKSDEISEHFNNDSYDPRDGEIIEAVDNLAAFDEAYLALKNGIKTQAFEDAMTNIRNAFLRKTIAGINFSEIYVDFE